MNEPFPLQMPLHLCYPKIFQPILGAGADAELLPRNGKKRLSFFKRRTFEIWLRSFSVIEAVASFYL